MVAGYHLIWTAYGYWLPNEPRGSTSAEIRVAALKPLGGIHFGRKKKQPTVREIAAFHERARDILRHPVLTFAPGDFAVIGNAIGEEIRAKGYICYASAIMPDHV